MDKSAVDVVAELLATKDHAPTDKDVVKWAAECGLDADEFEAAMCLAAFQKSAAPDGDKKIETTEVPTIGCPDKSYKPEKNTKDKATGDSQISKQGAEEPVDFYAQLGVGITKKALNIGGVDINDSLLYGAGGAAGGGILGYLLSDKDKLKNSIMGALAGGSLIGGGHHLLSQEDPTKPPPKPEVPDVYAEAPDSGYRKVHRAGELAPLLGGAMAFGAPSIKKKIGGRSWTGQKMPALTSAQYKEFVRSQVPTLLAAQGHTGKTMDTLSDLGVNVSRGKAIPGAVAQYKGAPQLQAELRKAVATKFKQPAFKGLVPNRGRFNLMRRGGGRAVGRTALGMLAGELLSRAVEGLTSRAEGM